MADKDPFDKLAIPPAKDPADLKLTITTIENKKKEIQKEIKDVLDGQKDNSIKIKKIINFIKDVKHQQKQNLELNKGLSEVVKEIDEFKKVIKNLDTPESVKNAGKELDGLIEDVKDHIKAHADNNEKFKKLFESHEKKFNMIPGVDTGLAKLKKIGSWFEEQAVFFRRQTGMQFCTYLTNTVVKTIGGLLSKAPMLTKLFGVLKGASSMFAWLGGAGKTVIEGIYNVFVKLASIGWKVLKGVFNVITYPIKVVGGIFSTVFGEILTSPTGFVCVTALLAGGIYFLAKPIATFAGKLFSIAWDWLTEAFDTYFISQEKKDRLMNFFHAGKETVVEWFSVAWNYFKNFGLANAWDATIGKLVPGISSESLKSMFDVGISTIKEAWNSVTNWFSMLVKNGVFDEIILLWNAISALIHGEESVIMENLKEDNRSVISEGYTALISREAEALVQSKVLDTFFNKYDGIKSPEAIEDLVNIANSVINNYLSQKIVSVDKEKNTKILSNVHLDARDIVMTLMSYKNPRLKQIQGSAGSREIGFGKKLLELKQIDSTSDAIPDITASHLKDLLGKNLNQYKNSKNRRYNSAPLSLPSANYKSLNTAPEYDASNMHFADSSSSSTVPKYASGAIVNKPTYALIGEGSSPEMVIPLNKEGLEFVCNSMKEMIIDADSTAANDKMSTRDVIKRIQKNKMAKPDAKVYDMRNLSTGLVGFR
jgi:hypothetical protein